MENSYKFFNNIQCKYFPCHRGIENKEFNCLFCYCPLYMLGDKCGGAFIYKNGVKSCISCNVPHLAKNYDYINKKLGEYIKRHQEEMRNEG